MPHPQKHFSNMLDSDDGNTTDSGDPNGISSSGKSDHSGIKMSEDNSSDSINRPLSKKESNHVFRLRVIVVLILIVAAAGVSMLVFYISKFSERDEYNNQFDGAKGQIFEAFEAIKTERISGLSSLGVAAISYGIDHSKSWPFVTLSRFQERALTMRSNSKVLQVSLHNLVTEDDRDQWEKYTVSNDSRWIGYAIDYQESVGLDKFIFDYGEDFTNATSQPIVTISDDHERVPVSGGGPYLPFWERSPFLHRGQVNVDFLDDPVHGPYARSCLETGSLVLGGVELAPAGNMRDSGLTGWLAQLLSIAAGEEVEYLGDPITYVYVPIFDSFDTSTRKTVAVLSGLFSWASHFKDVLPPNIRGVDVVLRNECYESFTYRINGGEVIPLGSGDLHDIEFESWGETTDILDNKGTVADGTREGLSFYKDVCHFTVSIYPSKAFHHTTNSPAIMTFAVAIIFAFAIFMFFVYDRLVERRQRLVLNKAVQSTAIVSSLFPKNVRDRLMQESSELAMTGSSAFRNSRHKSLLGEETKEDAENSKPIADLFPNCTVMFADIAGFTAWSSSREPIQVFTLLQAVYQAFDKTASKRRVFKVETIGDSYVAVTGLPEPQENHALIMCKFAKDCLVTLFKVTRELEVTLGPDTGDLSMRFGLNSGPVTAGVLRGDRARFQLFGDTVNTAARMESTGMRGRIQLSQTTADLIRSAGKDAWVQPRKDTVVAKGLGEVKTFWLEQDAKQQAVKSSQSINSSETGSEGDGETPPSKQTELTERTSLDTKHGRNVDWMTEVLSDYVKQIVAKRIACGKFSKRRRSTTAITYSSPEGKICLDEVVEALHLPQLDGKGISEDAESIELDNDVVSQLRTYVNDIAYRYQNNPFHNFDHACHVTMSVHKLLRRVANPDISKKDLAQAERDSNHLASRLHDFTHGINSDPVTLLAIVFSALIHDVDHRGVSNTQLGKEEPEMGQYYKHKSIAEQNSLDIAWDLLMTTKFDALRDCLFGEIPSELMRFRQVVINVVLATDIFDKELNDLRKARWNKAFSGAGGEIGKDDLQATIVLEHIIQASDVSHTMQHWHVYLKWNRRLFQEMSLAYRDGRMASDPVEFWYEGELQFFDNYILPLAKKLQECQVFGVSSDEYLNYAVSNRKEWEEKGKEVIKEMVGDMWWGER